MKGNPGKTVAVAGLAKKRAFDETRAQTLTMDAVGRHDEVQDTTTSSTRASGLETLGETDSQQRSNGQSGLLKFEGRSQRIRQSRLEEVPTNLVERKETRDCVQHALFTMHVEAHTEVKSGQIETGKCWRILRNIFFKTGNSCSRYVARSSL